MDKNKTILIVRNSYEYSYGGAEKYPVILAAELKKLNYKPVVVSNSKKVLSDARKFNIVNTNSLWWKKQNWDGYNNFILPVYFLWQLILFFWYLHIIKKFDVDVLHLQSKDDFIAGTLAGKLLKKKIIWTDHADLKHIFLNLKIWYKNPIGKTVFICSKLASHISVVSKSELNLIKNASGARRLENFSVIYNGVNDSFFKINKINKRLIFIMTSRLVGDKGILEAIDAFKIVFKKHKNTELQIYGTGPDEVFFKEKSADLPNIRFMGFSNNIPEKLSLANIYLHPTYHEGFSLSIVEATMMGLPIIATAVGGNPEIVQNNINGLLVPAKQVSNLSMAMEKLIEDKDLRENMGKESRRIYLESFQFKDIVNNQIRVMYE